MQEAKNTLFSYLEKNNTTIINIIRAILIILLIVQFATIFNFSNQDGEESGNLSREVTITVTKNVKSIQKLEKTKKEKVLDKIEHFIRKTAHFSLYTLVGILTMGLMSTYKIKQIKRIGISLGIGALYAISDEIHQSFIPDRTPLIGDIFIDSSGVCFGIIIVIVSFKVVDYVRSIIKKENVVNA